MTGRPADAVPFTVQERDIDLLLLEQLHTSAEFVDWFAAELSLGQVRFQSARHSVSNHLGETDVLLFVVEGERTVALMIEDKIGAAMQPDQCERYHERGKLLCYEGTAARYQTILCAPEAYLSLIPADSDWHHRLSFERLLEWFDQHPAPIALWRQSILRSAIEKLGRARDADRKLTTASDPKLAELKKEYWQYLQDNFPSLRASSLQLGGDREYYLKATFLPKGIRFKHSFFRGEVSLIFERDWAQRAQAWFSNNPLEGSWLTAFGGELHVRKSVEVMDPQIPVLGQEDVVRAALDAVVALSESVRIMLEPRV